MPVSINSAASSKRFQLRVALKKFWKNYEQARKQSAMNRIRQMSGIDLTKPEYKL